MISEPFGNRFSDSEAISKPFGKHFSDMETNYKPFRNLPTSKNYFLNRLETTPGKKSTL